MRTYADPAAFLERAQPFLEADETANNLILGVTLRLRERPEWIDAPPYLATVERGGVLTLVAAMTPPHSVLLAGVPDVPRPALEELIVDLRSNGWAVPGVSAEERLAQRFAQTWTHLTGQPHRLDMRMRAYELRRVIAPPSPPAGRLRPATLDDLGSQLPWRAAFHRESLHEDPPADLRQLLSRQIQDGAVYLWDDGGPVSTAATSRPTPHGLSIGSVYTPPERRGRGYASACVAALSQRILDSGKTFCTLFTDLDYPTSNAIYQKIGYQALCDFHVIHFAPPSA